MDTLANAEMKLDAVPAGLNTALGLGEATDEQNAEILDLVKQAGISKKDILTDAEFEAIATPVLSRKAA